MFISSLYHCINLNLSYCALEVVTVTLFAMRTKTIESYNIMIHGPDILRQLHIHIDMLTFNF